MATFETKPSVYVSIRELAQRLGLSKGTVSLALNDSPRVKASTLKKVKAAAKAAENSFKRMGILAFQSM